MGKPTGFLEIERHDRGYEKPSERMTRERADAIRRARKAARKQAQREGLIAAPRNKRPVKGRPIGARPFSSDGARSSDSARPRAEVFGS